MIIKSSGIIALFIGLIVGLVLMFAFQLISVYVEMLYVQKLLPIAEEDLAQTLQGSFFLNCYYLASWLVTILLPAYVTANLSRSDSHVFPLICGGIFYLILLVNPELIKANVYLYLIFVLLGALAVLFPAGYMKRMSKN